MLLDSGKAVHGVDRLGKTAGSPLHEYRLSALLTRPGFTFSRCDISDPGEALSLFEQRLSQQPPAAVINLAALAGVRGSLQDPRAFYEVNVLGTLNLLETCRKYGVTKFILASTSSVYGAEVHGPVGEEADSSRPLSPYAASKKAAETLAYSYHHLYGINAVALRYFTVYGPAGRPDMSMFNFIRSVAEGKPITLFGDGSQQRDFTFVDDVARGTVAALDTEGWETINLGYGQPVVLNDVIKLIEETVGKRASIEVQDRHPADPLTTWADNGRAREMLAWTPVVGIEEGIRLTFEWYRENREWARLLS